MDWPLRHCRCLAATNFQKGDNGVEVSRLNRLTYLQKHQLGEIFKWRTMAVFFMARMP
jgi:hypothetical protein